MNWILVLMLSATGLVLGIAGLFGVSGWLAWVLWIALGALCGIQIVRTEGEKLFAHGFLVGLFAGIVYGLVQIVFFGTYVANNPDAAQAYRNLQESMGGIGAQSLLLVETPLLSVGAGLLFGLLTMIAGRFFSAPGEMNEIIPPDVAKKENSSILPPGDKPKAG